jgi:diguanylate cyclase (GGDEF)-like protein
MVAYLAVAFGVFAVGVIDHVTGLDIHVVSLYVVPLAFAGWRLGRTGAAIASLLCTVVSLVALYTTGARYSQPYSLIVNFLTQGAAFLTVSLVVAALSEALRKEQSHSRTDSLTGLKNRLAFIEQARVALALCKRYARPVSLAYIDLDNFKNVNDSLGHARGDALLQKCGTMIAESLRASDIAARIGGDEFVVFLPETNAENALALFQRVHNALETSAAFRAVAVTASIGVVVDETAKSDIEELLKRADAQMYQVKLGSKNRVGLHLMENAQVT